ncbi:MAG TPA: pyruvate dehydrogenase (acetyl-transferring) E1 component subunit alpha, partial [Gammaproteobacteria bacterium]|nr:pyruvate dehydrogenase (acetyl-transferring) E1 component subunit alpha [Gammaproteobacteria bacterium]
GPYFLELKTYRFRGHSMSDSNVYRDKSEEEQWAGRDPIQILKNRMLESQEITEEEYKSLDKEILDTIENEVVAFARQAPSPDVEDLEKYVLCDTDGDSEQGVNTNG